MHRSALKRIFLLVLAFLCLWSTAMCAVAASSKVKSLKLPSIAVIVKGNKLTLKATVSPAGTKITWKSSNKRIATVNTNGKVTGVGIGEAKITATAGNKKASCTVRVVKKKGMYKDKGKTYYCNPKTGLLAKGLTTIGSAKYYFHPTKSYMLTGLQKIKGKTYYFAPSTGKMQKGLQTINKKLYFFDKSTGAQKTGMIRVNTGKTYNFLKKGGVTHGWLTSGSNTYYFHKTEGYMLTGLQKIDNDTYYFQKSKGYMLKGSLTIDKKKYYFDPTTGAQKTGLIKDEKGNCYNFLKEGGVSKGFTVIDSNTYYFNPSTGIMIAGKVREIPGGSKKFYYFAADTGIMQTGFQTVNDYRYYFDPQTGIAATGITKVEGDTFYFNENNAKMKFGKQTVNGLSYFFDEQTGKQCTGFVSIKKDSKTYVYHYLPEGGVSKGFTVIDSNTYYFNPDTGVMIAGKVCEIPEGSKKFYYFAADTGIMQTGFQTVEDKRYYFDPKTSIAALGLTDIDGELYLFDENSGKMRMGMRVVNDKRYYFDPTTGQAINGVRKVDSTNGFTHYIYFDLKEASGCRMGLQEYESEYYFFHEVSYFAKEGFRTIDKSVYYFDPDNGYKANRNKTWNYKGVTLEANNKGVVSAISDDGSTRSRVLRWAFNHVGYDYGTGAGQYGCSSFVSGAYEYAGKSYLTLDNSKAENQMKLLLQYDPDCIKATNTIPSDLKPGDLMFWEDPSCNDPNCDRRFTYNGKDYHIHHVSLYAGDNLIAEAASVELGTRITYKSDEAMNKLRFIANVIDSNLPANPEVDYSKFTTPSSLTSNAMGSMEGQEDAAQGSADESFMDGLSIGEDELFPDLLDLSALELDLLLDDVEIGELMAPEGDLTLDAAQNQDSSMEFELELP
ncbi:MAG: Ig-like domain-containing protein [Clostridia bacterium]|nr:Ig-like domain-containing protein [Clostridia bacterium]